MTDETKLRKDMEMAARARAIMDDPAVVQAFDGLQAAYYSAWCASDAPETEARERLYLASGIVAQVRNHLLLAIENGKIANIEINTKTGRPA